MAQTSANPETGENLLNADMQRQHFKRFCELFSVTATFQGRLAYFLMSIQAVNPYILRRVTDYDPEKILYANMVYGLGVMLYCRPSMRPISKFNRAALSILGSLMFNHSSMAVFAWLVKHYSHRPYILTILGFLSGRIMMLHLLIYLYNVDSRYRGVTIRQYADYESMYR